MTIKDFLSENGIPFEENVSLACKSWIKFGGISALWISPISVDQLEKVCRYLYAKGIVFDIVGQTSNIFFHTTYNPQVVVSTIRVKGYWMEGDVLICDCGCSVIRLAKDMLAKGYTGFYGLVGLPGTVASAAVNNAGCFNCSVSSMLVSADVLLPEGNIATINKEDFRYTNRSSAFKRGDRKGVILSVKLKVNKAEDIEEEYRKSEKTKLYRKKNQEGPRLNLGSVFYSKKLKRNFKNLLVILISKLLSGLRVMPKRKAFKNALLYLYGYRDISSYISDRNLNTFVWRDDKAEIFFNRYKQMISDAYDNPLIEIEEKY